jgi:SnoaL-like domain
MSTPHTLADRYLATWNEADAARRRALIAALWNPQGRYADPLMSGQGHDGIARMIEAARAQFPGLQFTPRGEPDGHGPFTRFSWSLAPAGGAPVAGGTDVVRLDDQGRIAEVIGFLDGSAGHA